MRVISWNCNQAFRKKVNHILPLRPDILVVQECEAPDKLMMNLWESSPQQYFWFGDNPNKGIAVFNFDKNLEFTPLSMNFENKKWFIPFKVVGTGNFYIEAVWAMNHRANQKVDGIKPSYKTLEEHSEYLGDNSIIIGDFNNSVIWDPKRKGIGCFSDIISLLESYGMKSCYHLDPSKPFGRESSNTFCWRKNLDTCYHIDYCFAGTSFMDTLVGFQVQGIESWLNLSDHAPIIAEFK